MTTHETTVRETSADDRCRRPVLLAAALGFVLLYLSNDFVAPNLASSALPLPDDPVAEVRTWFAENQLAAVTTGILQFLSVSCLAAS